MRSARTSTAIGANPKNGRMAEQGRSGSGPACETCGTLESDGAELAWRGREGRGPTVVWLGGFRSEMTGNKAQALDAWAQRAGRAFVRFDYFAHGASGGAFEDATISRWRADALAVIDQLTEGRLVLVGSSMGGWLACLAAMARPERIAGLVLIAPAADFTERLLRPSLPRRGFGRDRLARRLARPFGLRCGRLPDQPRPDRGRRPLVDPARAGGRRGAGAHPPGRRGPRRALDPRPRPRPRHQGPRRRLHPDPTTATTASPAPRTSPAWSSRWRRSVRQPRGDDLTRRGAFFGVGEREGDIGAQQADLVAAVVGGPVVVEGVEGLRSASGAAMASVSWISPPAPASWLASTAKISRLQDVAAGDEQVGGLGPRRPASRPCRSSAPAGRRSRPRPRQRDDAVLVRFALRRRLDHDDVAADRFVGGDGLRQRRPARRPSACRAASPRRARRR